MRLPSSASLNFHRLIPWLLVPSGCAALIYQVSWVRLLGLSMGSTSAAVSIVLAAFFLGMTLGSWLADRLSAGNITDIRRFAGLEGLIALTGLVLLPLLLHLDHGMSLLGPAGAWMPAKFIICLLLLVIPTACMGATYPMIAAAWISDNSSMSNGLGRLYALNTAGAIAGAAGSGFLLIPWLGLDGSVYVAMSLNIAAALLGLTVARSSNQNLRKNAIEPHQVNEAGTTPFQRKSIIYGSLLFCTGFLAIANEVAWTKYLSIFVGATLYGFAAILSIFLMGIAAGSWANKHFVNPKSLNTQWIGWALFALSISLLMARVGLAWLPEATGWLDSLPWGQHWSRYGLAFIVLFPATFMFGALFPATLALYCESAGQFSRRVGHGYAINTLGSILGSLVAGFYLIPGRGSDWILSASVFLTCWLALLFLWHKNKRPLPSLVAIGLLVTGTHALPHLDYQRLITANPYRFDSDAMAGKQPRFHYLKEGKAGVISLVSYDNSMAHLQNNGIQESFIPLSDQVHPPFTEVMLGIVPYLLHPDANTAFIVGFGGGNTLQAAARTPLEYIKVVELEAAVIDAVRVAHGGQIAFLQDPRIHLEINDARNTLLVEPDQYDLILSQPSHPWLSGAGNLFTRDFFEITHGRLTEDGIFVQWVNLFNMDSTTLKSILKGFFEVYEHGFTFANTSNGDLLVFGSRKPMVMDYDTIRQRLNMPGIQQAMSPAQIRNPEDLLWYFALSRREILASTLTSRANTDTQLLSEVRLARLSSDPSDRENPYVYLNEHSSFDALDLLPERQAELFVYRAGQYFFHHHSTTRARRAIDRLSQINPDLARQLQAEWKRWRDSFRSHPR